MKQTARPADYYDRMYEQGGYGGVYDLPYRHSSYLPLFKAMMAEVKRSGARSVLEVGCGNGAFAHLLMDSSDIAYCGFDFSPVAVDKARRRTGRHRAFVVADALDPDSYGLGYDTIVCSEVLEHVDDDLGVMRHWRRGTYCICSVPNFDADSHVRFFADEAEVRKRYGAMLHVERITRIRKPALPDISWKSYARALRWYRYRPLDLIAVLGVGTFASLGGWFLFCGRRQ